MTTSAEREHLGKVASLGCIVCRNLGLGKTPAEVHHLRAFAGTGQRAKHKQTIPLCAAHHRTGAGGAIAFHRAPGQFQATYGTETALLRQTEKEIESLTLLT